MSAFHTAQFYELLGNRSGRLEREGNFLLEALAAAPSRNVADLACGLGVHALFFAEQGATVTATDLSAEMIQHASATRPHKNITYAVADMRTPSGGPYGLVVCLGNSLSLLSEESSLSSFFSGAANVLAPQGLLIVQVLNYDAPAMRRPRIRTEHAVLDNGDIAAVKRFLPMKESTLLSITYYSATLESFVETTEIMHLRHWSSAQLRKSSENTALEILGFYGDFNSSPIEKTSTDIILVARKSV